MSEHYPLLCDDLSEEERFSPHFHRRLLMNRGRARNHVKGAAAIITRWTDHWTTLLTYWWIGISMIAVTTFFIYNSLFSYAMFQPTSKLLNKPNNIKLFKPAIKESASFNVLMHIFLDNNQELDLNQYLPYIEVVTNKYTQFKYELIVVTNDTNVESKKLSDEKNNELAFNMLWSDDLHHKNFVPSNKKWNIKYVMLSQYLHDSPLKKYWESLPNQFIKFLVRAISVWEKGGIAFDPIVLTPQSPHSNYIDKIHNILKKFKIKKEKTETPKQRQLIPTNERTKNKPVVNNIRDIIKALESEDTSEKSYQGSLIEAETKDNLTIVNSRRLFTIIDTSVKAENETKLMKFKEIKNDLPNDITVHHKDVLHTESTREKLKTNTSPTLNLLPLFLDYLFHNKQTKMLDEITTNTVPKSIYNEDKANEKGNDNNVLWTDIKNQDSYKPVIISAKGIFNESVNAKKPKAIVSEDEHLFEVTIDLGGYIIATDTACHSFIGGMFSNAIYHDLNESVSDFIIKELSIFCKGLFASCVGIDLILL